MVKMREKKLVKFFISQTRNVCYPIANCLGRWWLNVLPSISPFCLGFALGLLQIS